MPTEGDLATFRELAGLRMTSRATVRRKTGATTTSANGLQVPVWVDVYTNIPCRIDASGSSDGGSRGVTVGGITYEEATGVDHFPHPSPLLKPNDVACITSGEWSDEFHRIVAVPKYDQKTARRVPIVDVERPEGWV